VLEGTRPALSIMMIYDDWDGENAFRASCHLPLAALYCVISSESNTPS
jgi:hypothetical protein